MTSKLGHGSIQRGERLPANQVPNSPEGRQHGQRPTASLEGRGVWLGRIGPLELGAFGGPHSKLATLASRQNKPRKPKTGAHKSDRQPKAQPQPDRSPSVADLALLT